MATWQNQPLRETNIMQKLLNNTR